MNAASEYCALLLKHGVGLPVKMTGGYDFEGLARRSKNKDVVCAITYGLVVVDGPRFCRVCGQEASPARETTKCLRCGDGRKSMVPPNRMLVLPPVVSVLEGLRDELLSRDRSQSAPGSLTIAFAIERLAKVNGLELKPKAAKVARWLTGKWWPKSKHPMDGFAHIIRSPFDPDRSSREQRRKIRGKDPVAWKKDLKSGDVARWKREILRLLGDREPRTFNRIVLELTDGQHTADIARGNDPDAALWSLVEAKNVEHTDESPVLFRKRSAR